jgi:hypothetical protein
MDANNNVTWLGYPSFNLLNIVRNLQVKGAALLKYTSKSP